VIDDDAKRAARGTNSAPAAVMCAMEVTGWSAAPVVPSEEDDDRAADVGIGVLCDVIPLVNALRVGVSVDDSDYARVVATVSEATAAIPSALTGTHYAVFVRLERAIRGVLASKTAALQGGDEDAHRELNEACDLAAVVAGKHSLTRG
jgi:hypothetical protein